MPGKRPDARGPDVPGPALGLVFAVITVIALTSCRVRDKDDAPPPETGSSGVAESGDQAVAATPDRDPDTAPAQRQDTVKMIYEKTPGSFAHLIERHKGAVVNIRGTRKVKGGPASIYPGAPHDESLGSGFVISRDGSILTDLRIVATVGEIRVVSSDGEEHPAKVIGTDPHLELALLRAEGIPASVPVLQLDDSESIDLGQWVVALGSPFAGEIIANPGVITGVGKRREIANPPQQKYRGYLHTDAAIHAGNSGGPLLDMGGNVVGVNHAVAPGASRQSAALGFAVPAGEITRILERLSQGNVVDRAWLGLRFQPVNQARATEVGLTVARGARITEVRAGEPADRAGLETGDVILEFDGSEVSADNLPGLLHRAGPAKDVEVVIWRGGQERNVRVKTGRMLR